MDGGVGRSLNVPTISGGGGGGYGSSSGAEDATSIAASSTGGPPGSPTLQDTRSKVIEMLGESFLRLAPVSVSHASALSLHIWFSSRISTLSLLSSHVMIRG